MRRLLRPSILTLLTATLAFGAMVLVLWPWWEGPGSRRPTPRPVPEGDQEVVWLNPATSTVTWERFVTAVRRVQVECSALQMTMDDTNAFPKQTTAIPELALSALGHKTRLWIRWYKLTADQKIDDWVEALVGRRPPPLAIIGGGSSDRARDLALKLQEVANRLGDRAAPLFLITTATADQVPAGDDPSRALILNRIYPGRAFRFCFTNRQMAEAVTDFVWSQDELRPDAEPVYMAAWQDDPFSEDLADRFRDVLWESRYRASFRQMTILRAGLRVWMRLAGYASVGGCPPGLIGTGLSGTDVLPAGPFWRALIPYSIGTFNQPNRPEGEAAEKLIDELSQHPDQLRPLLVLPATAQPARRFLRGLMQVAPTEAARFVVVTGDSIDFNTLYRDRNLTWPIQDLPFNLVLFFHRNPVEQTAFAEDGTTQSPHAPALTATGTEDLLLYADIVNALVEGAFEVRGLVPHAEDLRARLRQSAGVHFDDDGNRAGGTGEYIVHLQPLRDGDRVLPRARLRVYRAKLDEARRWVLIRELAVAYTRGRQLGYGVPPGGGVP